MHVKIANGKIIGGLRPNPRLDPRPDLLVIQLPNCRGIDLERAIARFISVDLRLHAPSHLLKLVLQILQRIHCYGQ